MKTSSWIRTVYLYLMTTVGIVVFIIGAVTILNLLLKIFIFTNADEDYYQPAMPRELYLEPGFNQVEAIKECEELTESDKEQIRLWLADYKKVLTDENGVDRKRAQRERDAARALAMVLVGLPVWLYHWSVIKRDKRKEEE